MKEKLTFEEVIEKIKQDQALLESRRGQFSVDGFENGETSAYIGFLAKIQDQLLQDFMEKIKERSSEFLYDGKMVRHGSVKLSVMVDGIIRIKLASIFFDTFSGFGSSVYRYCEQEYMNYYPFRDFNFLE